MKQSAISMAMNHRTALRMNRHGQNPSRICVARRRAPRALGRHYGSFRNRRILRRHCTTTNHVHCTTRKIAWPRTARGLLSLHEKEMLREVHEILVGEGVNLICACACPPCWRRSNGTIHDRRSVPSTSASASKRGGEGGWLIGTRYYNSVEK
jgi:hypothetical protein